MTDKKLTAQAYCVAAEKLDAAVVVLEDAKKVIEEIHSQLQDIRKQMSEGIPVGETVVILLPKNMSVVVTNHNGYTQADISRTV